MTEYVPVLRVLGLERSPHALDTTPDRHAWATITVQVDEDEPVTLTRAVAYEASRHEDEGTALVYRWLTRFGGDHVGAGPIDLGTIQLRAARAEAHDDVHRDEGLTVRDLYISEAISEHSWATPEARRRALAREWDRAKAELRRIQDRAEAARQRYAALGGDLSRCCSRAAEKMVRG